MLNNQILIIILHQRYEKQIQNESESYLNRFSMRLSEPVEFNSLIDWTMFRFRVVAAGIQRSSMFTILSVPTHLPKFQRRNVASTIALYALSENQNN